MLSGDCVQCEDAIDRIKTFRLFLTSTGWLSYAPLSVRESPVIGVDSAWTIVNAKFAHAADADTRT